MASSNSTLYDQDYFRWITENVALLRAGAVDQADLDHIAEELEDLGKSQKRELNSRIRVILIHLLKCEYSTAPSERNLNSWQSTLDMQRSDLADHLGDSPSLASRTADVIEQVYPGARKLAARQMRVSPETFPVEPPYTPDQVLNIDFVPRR